jgi:hypothetical protein
MCGMIRLGCQYALRDRSPELLPQGSTALPSLRLDPPGGRVISIGVDRFMGVETFRVESK